MKYLSQLPRYLLGLIYFVFGINGFLIPFGMAFLPMPPEVPGPAADFGKAMFATGYFFMLVKITEIIGGAILLLGRPVPFALILLAPITVNIFLFHFFLTPGDFALPLVMVIIHLFLGFQYRRSFRPLFQ